MFEIAPYITFVIVFATLHYFIPFIWKKIKQKKVERNYQPEDVNILCPNCENILIRKLPFGKGTIETKCNEFCNKEFLIDYHIKHYDDGEFSGSLIFASPRRKPSHLKMV